MKKDNSPVVGFFATVSDRSIGSVGYYPVIDGDVEGARARAVAAIDAWEGHGSPTPHTLADRAEGAAIVAAYDPSAVRTPRERAMRRRQRAAGKAAREAALAQYA